MDNLFTFTLSKTVRFLGSLLLLGALWSSLVLNDSTPILLVLLPLVILDRTFLIPILFTIPLVEGVYATGDTSSNAETIAIAMLVPVLGYDLLRNNKVNVPTRLLALFVVFIIMTIIGYVVYRRHPYISKAVALWVHLPGIPAAGKVAAKTAKLLFFIVYLKLLVNYGKEYIYKALTLYRALSPYIILSIAFYTLKYGVVSDKFGGIVHFGEASHGDFTASLDALAVYMFIALFERKNNYFEKVVSLFSILMLFYLIMNMGSRNGLLSFIFVTGLSVILVLANRSGSMIFLMIFAGIIAVGTSIILFKDSPTVNRFIYEMEEESGGERIGYWSAGFRSITYEPLLGLGGDETSSIYAVSRYSPDVEAHIMHNTFLEVAVEYGLLGLLFYVIFVFTILKWGYKCFMYAIETNDLILATPAVSYTVSIFAGLFISRVWETPLWYDLCLIFAIGILWVIPQVKYNYQRKKRVLPAYNVEAYAFAD